MEIILTAIGMIASNAGGTHTEKTVQADLHVQVDGGEITGLYVYTSDYMEILRHDFNNAVAGLNSCFMHYDSPAETLQEICEFFEVHGNIEDSEKSLSHLDIEWL